MPAEAGTLVTLAASDASDVGNVLVDAFYDYPIMRFVLGEEADYRARLQLLISLFVANRALRHDPMAGVRAGNELLGVVTMSYPLGAVNPPAFELLREEVWRRLGPATRQRYDRCVAAWSPLAPEVAQLHVNMIGVRPAHQGRGLARVLLDHAHRLALANSELRGVSLTTEVPANVQIYQHFGYRIFDQRQIAPGLVTWGLFRWHDGEPA